MTGPRCSPEGYEVLRQTVTAIEVHPAGAGREVSVTIHGDLAAFLHLDEAKRAARQTRTPVLGEENGRFVGCMKALVAGTGFEPVTFRL